MPKLKTLYSKRQINKRIRSLAAEIIPHYPDGLYGAVILEGAMPFAMDLTRALTSQGLKKVQYSSMMVDSGYQGSHAPLKEPSLLLDIKENKGKLSDPEISELFKRYLKEVQKLWKIVDTLEKGGD